MMRQKNAVSRRSKITWPTIRDIMRWPVGAKVLLAFVLLWILAVPMFFLINYIARTAFPIDPNNPLEAVMPAGRKTLEKIAMWIGIYSLLGWIPVVIVRIVRSLR